MARPGVCPFHSHARSTQCRAQVDGAVVDFFVPAAERLLAAAPDPQRVLAASLAALSGFRAAPQPRSLLTYEEGFITLRLLGTPGG